MRTAIGAKPSQLADHDFKKLILLVLKCFQLTRFCKKATFIPSLLSQSLLFKAMRLTLDLKINERKFDANFKR